MTERVEKVLGHFYFLILYFLLESFLFIEHYEHTYCGKTENTKAY